jgi:hypothetical protein
MGILEQILIALVAAFIGLLAGRFWEKSLLYYTYWRARRFWRPFVSGDVQVVVGRFKRFAGWEPSGLVGVGDMQATAELVAFFDDVGYRRLGRSPKIAYHDQLAGPLADVSLVCIGGPDANKLTKYMLETIHPTIEPGDPEGHVVSFRDTKTNRLYSPIPEQRRGLWSTLRASPEAVTVDYGLLVKASNPFNANRGVIIIAGSFGYGTWAGIKLARSERFLRDKRVRKGRAIECLYSTTIINEIPQQPEIEVLREISHQEALGSEQSGSRRYELDYAVDARTAARWTTQHRWHTFWRTTPHRRYRASILRDRQHRGSRHG